jgi:hypothetical protein
MSKKVLNEERSNENERRQKRVYGLKWLHKENNISHRVRCMPNSIYVLRV